MNELPNATRGRRIQFFDQLETDQLISTLLATLSELSVTKERQFAMERLFCKKGIINEGEIDAYVFSPEEEAVMDANQQKMLEEAFYPLQFDYRKAQKRLRDQPVMTAANSEPAQDDDMTSAVA